jgi:hypothetical protein
VHVLQRRLADEGVRSKVNTARRSGRVRGGGALNRGALYHLLQNRTYLGEVVHGADSHPGLHAPIIDPGLFNAVGVRLKENTRALRDRSMTAATAPLRGKLFDEKGDPMSPTVSYGRAARAYRYYVSSTLQRGAAEAAGALRRVPAPQLEGYLSDLLKRMGAAADLAMLQRVELHPQHFRLVVPASAVLRSLGEAALPSLRSRLAPGERASLLECGALELIAPQRLSFCGGRTWIVGADNKPARSGGRADPAVAKALRSAHTTVSELGVGPTSAPERLHAAKAVPHPHLRALSRLAFLAPDIQAAILDGRLAPHINVSALTVESLPLAWADQRAMLGL